MRDELELGQGERLPWLETAEEYDQRRQRSWTIVLAVLGGLLALLLVIGGIWYTQRERARAGNGELIAAPTAPYKERADGTDGMVVGSDSDAMLAASEGQEARGRLATAPPVAPPPVAQEVPTTNTGSAAVGSSDAGTVREEPASRTGAAVQLGAFNDRPSAEAQWVKLSGSRGELKGLTRSIEQVQAGGKTVYRLRANVADAKAGTALCRSLQSGGVPCFTVR